MLYKSPKFSLMTEHCTFNAGIGATLWLCIELDWWINKSSFNNLTSVFVDAPSTEQQELFSQKLHQCCIMFDFLDSVTDLKSKEIKRSTLNELVDYVSTNRGVLVESAYPEITEMVRIYEHCSRFFWIKKHVKNMLWKWNTNCFAQLSGHLSVSDSVNI